MKSTPASTSVSARAATARPETVPGSNSPRCPISCSSASSRIFPSGRPTDSRCGTIIDRGGVTPLYLQGSSRFIPKENLLVRSNNDVDEWGLVVKGFDLEKCTGIYFIPQRTVL